MVGEGAGFADFRQYVDETRELLRQFFEHLRGRLVGAQSSRPSIGIASQTHVVVEIDRLAHHAIREEPRDEERKVARRFEECESACLSAGDGLTELVGEGLIVVDARIEIGTVGADE